MHSLFILHFTKSLSHPSTGNSKTLCLSREHMKGGIGIFDYQFSACSFQFANFGLVVYSILYFKAFKGDEAMNYDLLKGCSYFHINDCGFFFFLFENQSDQSLHYVEGKNEIVNFVQIWLKYYTCYEIITPVISHACARQKKIFAWKVIENQSDQSSHCFCSISQLLLHFQSQLYPQVFLPLGTHEGTLRVVQFTLNASTGDYIENI